MENEGKYRKKKESSTSKSKYKSKHKHEYESCLIRYPYHNSDNKHIHICSYCIVCGKIGSSINNFRSMCEKTENGLWRLLNNEEILKRNDDIPVFDLDDWQSKYVPLENI